MQRLFECDAFECFSFLGLSADYDLVFVIGQIPSNP